MPSNLLDVLKEPVAEAMAASKTAQDQVVENSKSAQQVSAQAVELLRQVATDVSTVNNAKQTATMKVQQAQRNLAIAAGVNPDDGSGTIMDLVSTMVQKQKEAKDLLTTVQEEGNVNPLTNPIGWIKAKVDWSGNRYKLQNTVEQLKLADASLGDVNKGLTESFQTTAKLEGGLTQATIEASSRILAADATMNAYKAQLEGLRHNTEEVTAIANGTKDRLNFMYQLNTALRQDEQYNLSVKEFQLRIEKFNWEKEQRGLERAARELKTSADELSVQYINASRANFGAVPMTAAEYRVQKEIGLKPELQFHLINGQRILATGKASVGDTPAAANEILKQIPSNLPEIRADVVRLIGQAEQELNMNAEKNPIQFGDTKDNASRRAEFINKRVRDEINRQFSSVAAGSGNLFDVGNVGTFIARVSASPVLAPGTTIGAPVVEPGIGSLFNHPLSQKVLLPLIKNGQTFEEPKVLLGVTLESIKRGLVSTSEAADGITSIYRTANAINQAQRTFNGFGIYPPAGGKQYNARIAGSGEVVNLADPVAVGSYLNRQLVKSGYDRWKNTNGR